MSDPRLELIKSKIRTIPDFPIQGILFRDVSSLFKDPIGLKTTIDVFVEHFEKIHREKPIDYIAGLEARGFILAPAIALRLGIGFLMVRKKGKLPGDTIQKSYGLEYGTDVFEVHSDAVTPGQRVVLIDDLIATGGSLQCAAALIEQLGGEVVEYACIVELPALNGREKLGSSHNIYTMVEFEGH
jgi:adenine phosphoribosyltransferase